MVTSNTLLTGIGSAHPRLAPVRIYSNQQGSAVYGSSCTTTVFDAVIPGRWYEWLAHLPGRLLLVLKSVSRALKIRFADAYASNRQLTRRPAVRLAPTTHETMFSLGMALLNFHTCSFSKL